MFRHPAWVATVMAHQLPELNPSQREVFTILMCQPVVQFTETYDVNTYVDTDDPKSEAKSTVCKKFTCISEARQVERDARPDRVGDLQPPAEAEGGQVIVVVNLHFLLDADLVAGKDAYHAIIIIL